MLPVPIKPKQIGVKLRTQLANLSVHKLQKALPTYRILTQIVPTLIFEKTRIIIVRPIQQRIIGTKLKTLFAQGRGKWDNHITLGRRLRYNTQRQFCIPQRRLLHFQRLVGTQTPRRIRSELLGIPQGNAIVMLGGNHGILRTAFLDQCRPSLRIIIFRGEAFQLTHIIGIRCISAVKTPTFRCPFHRIDAPMNKNSQLGICEPLHFWGDAIVCDSFTGKTLIQIRLSYEFDGAIHIEMITRTRGIHRRTLAHQTLHKTKQTHQKNHRMPHTFHILQAI